MALDVDARIIVVLTRLSETSLSVTYCDDVAAPRPYIITVVLSGPPFVALGAAIDDVPAIGRTTYRVMDT